MPPKASSCSLLVLGETEPVGTFQICVIEPTMSVIGGKADLQVTRADVCAAVSRWTSRQFLAGSGTDLVWP
jgi:hypothetical protein